MADEDHLDRSVSLEASLTDSGIKASAKSRFIAAIDRLLGGALDWPAAYFDGKAQLRRLENEIVLQSRKEAAEINQQSLSELQRLDKAVEISARLANARKHLNSRAVAIDALEDLRESPPNIDTTESIEDDWLNAFDSLSKLASSDRMQALWGKVLAGQVRKPGAFSVTTLRLLAELDQGTAILFSQIIKQYFNNGMIVLDSGLSGNDLIDVVTLDELGYINQGAGLISTFEFDQSGNAATLVLDKILVMKGQPNTSFTVQVAKLTRAGEEIRSLIAIDTGENVAAAKIVEQGGPNVQSATLYDVLEHLPNGQVRHSQLGKVIKGPSLS